MRVACMSTLRATDKYFLVEGADPMELHAHYTTPGHVSQSSDRRDRQTDRTECMVTSNITPYYRMSEINPRERSDSKKLAAVAVAAAADDGVGVAEAEGVTERGAEAKETVQTAAAVVQLFSHTGASFGIPRVASIP